MSAEKSEGKQSAAQQPSYAYTWLALYFVCNLTLTIYNKAVMQLVGFHFPWALTAVHTLSRCVCCLSASRWRECAR